MTTRLSEIVFWVSMLGVVYPYVVYPALLWLLARVRARPSGPSSSQPAFPSVSLIIPVHNEEARIGRKLENTRQLPYPGPLQVLVVSDGSTDRTVEIARAAGTGITVVELPTRGGKAAALNAGLERATHDIVVFSDASIELDPDALVQIVQSFQDPIVGCASGEDRILETGGEGWYGRYELGLRHLESALHSIVGASGSFYAQRRALCDPFVEGMAPDFLSVLRTVERGFRAVSVPSAVGSMSSVKDPKREFERKVRTVIRGMTTLFAHRQLLNPLRSGVFAFELLSHKVLRWTVPFFLVSALLSPLPLLTSRWYLLAFGSQVLFYTAAWLALTGYGGVGRTLPGKVALYFSSVNAAILRAWYAYARGVRQELWTPSAR